MLHGGVGFGSFRSPIDLADALGRVGVLQVSVVGSGRSRDCGAGSAAGVCRSWNGSSSDHVPAGPEQSTSKKTRIRCTSPGRRLRAAPALTLRPSRRPAGPLGGTVRL